MINPRPTSPPARRWRPRPDGTVDYGGHQVDAADLAGWISRRLQTDTLEVWLYARGFPAELAAEAAAAYTPAVSLPGAVPEPLLELAARVDDLIDMCDATAVTGTYGGTLIARQLAALRQARLAVTPPPATARLRVVEAAPREPAPDHPDPDAVAALVGRVAYFLEEWDEFRKQWGHSDALEDYNGSPLADEIDDLRNRAASFTDLSQR